MPLAIHHPLTYRDSRDQTFPVVGPADCNDAAIIVLLSGQVTSGQVTSGVKFPLFREVHGDCYRAIELDVVPDGL